MNCIFDNFNKKEAISNPFVSNSTTPGKFIFPSKGTELAQAIQHQQHPKPFLFGDDSSTTFGQPATSFPPFLPPATSFPPCIPQTHTRLTSFPPFLPPPQSFFPLVTQKPLFQETTLSTTFNRLNSSLQRIPVRVTKYVGHVSLDKILAVLSSYSYVVDENMTTVSQLAPQCDYNDIAKVAPLAIVSFIEDLQPLQPLQKLHVNFLKELIKESLTTEDHVWNYVEQMATSGGLVNIVQYINAVRPHKILNLPKDQSSNSEIAFVLALHSFATHNNRPHEAMANGKNYSKVVAKLVADMCMASYGLSWVLETQTPDYITKHMNTYILTP